MTLTLEQISAGLAGCPFVVELGITANSWEAEEGILCLTMPFAARLERVLGTGQFHGGAIAALIDTAATFALVGRLAKAVPTVDLRTDFLRPAMGASLLAEARIQRAGKSVAIVDVTVMDETNKTIALGRGSFGTAS